MSRRWAAFAFLLAVAWIAAVAGASVALRGAARVPPGAPPAGDLALPADLAEARADGLPGTTGVLNVDPVPLQPDTGWQAWTWTGPLGPMPALRTTPREGGPRPAVIWLSDDLRGHVAPAGTTPVVQALVGTGAVVVLPALRGQHGAPGAPELLGGEVDDVVALLHAVAALPDVDPDRVVLAGADRGGTLAWLAAAASPAAHLALSLGGRPDLCAPGLGLPLDPDDPRACALRSPARFRPRSPVLHVDGAVLDTGSCAVARRAVASPGGPLTTLCVPGHDARSYRPLAVALFATRLARAVTTGGPVQLAPHELLHAVAVAGLAELPLE